MVASFRALRIHPYATVAHHRYRTLSLRDPPRTVSLQKLQEQQGETSMYLVMGITGKVGGATARHLLKQGKQVRALVRNREKATKWADQGVQLMDGDWNDSIAIAAALKVFEGAFAM